MRRERMSRREIATTRGLGFRWLRFRHRALLTDISMAFSFSVCSRCRCGGCLAAGDSKGAHHSNGVNAGAKNTLMCYFRNSL